MTQNDEGKRKIKTPCDVCTNQGMGICHFCLNYKGWELSDELIKRSDLIAEVEGKISHCQKDDINSPFSNRNLKFSDGYNAAIDKVKQILTDLKGA